MIHPQTQTIGMVSLTQYIIASFWNDSFIQIYVAVIHSLANGFMIHPQTQMVAPIHKICNISRSTI